MTYFFAFAESYSLSQSYCVARPLGISSFSQKRLCEFAFASFSGMEKPNPMNKTAKTPAPIKSLRNKPILSFAPQLGQFEAELLTSFLHSLHVVIAISKASVLITRVEGAHLSGLIDDFRQPPKWASL
jgi:hypothetical protein